VHVETWDSAFVRARRADVHPVLRAVGSYGGWWPGLRVAARPEGALLRHDPPGFRGGAHRVDVVVAKDRTDLGVDFTLGLDIVGKAEWYYLDEVDGTVVHYLLRGEVADRGGRRLVAAHRASVRAALDVLKDRLEGARVPGSEPDPGLLADQREAMAAFRAGVEAFAAKRAAADHAAEHAAEKRDA
jgi:hypothetical protein